VGPRLAFGCWTYAELHSIGRTDNAMADLIAIGYPDETTAEAAAAKARQLAS
jgi:hypothetical protein